MDQLFSPYLSAIKSINWQEIDTFVFPSPLVKEWLLEQGSLSKRMQQHCEELDVELYSNQWLDGGELDEVECALLNAPRRYLLRQVILSGDHHPWVIGYSQIPQTTAQDSQTKLEQLGETPLGTSIFNARSVSRDHLQLAEIETPSGLLFARRSRLWVNQHPLLVTELFLPFAPLYRYRQESE